jgi:hypothetical protein
MSDPQVLDTPIGFAQQIIEDAAISQKAGVKLSEPMARYLMLAKAYLERTEELRKANNGLKALEHDLAIYKSLAGRAPGGEYDDSPLVSER